MPGLLKQFLAKPHGAGAPCNIYMFTPRAVARHLRTLLQEPHYSWSRLQVMTYQFTHPRDPWLTAEAIRIIDSYLTRDMLAWEWGSGKSTLWLARRVKTLVSVEHDARWYAQVSGQLVSLNLSNVEYQHRESLDYARSLQPTRSLDFILVDGENRNECIRVAAAGIKPGGLVAVDNADSRYDFTPLAGFRRQDTSNGVWQTALFWSPR